MKKQKSKAQKDMPGCVREAAVVSPIEVVVESEGQYRNADKYYQTAAASHSYCLTAEGDSTNQQEYIFGKYWCRGQLRGGT